MPTYEKPPSFLADYSHLDYLERAAFKDALQAFIEDLRAWERDGMVGRPQFRTSLRVKDIKVRKGVWEMTWQWPDGRATFQYGPPLREDHAHIMWRRIGTHSVLKSP
jgi:hypothetical protein